MDIVDRDKLAQSIDEIFPHLNERSTGKNPSLFILKTFNYYILYFPLIKFTIYSAEFGTKKKIGTFYRLINERQRRLFAASQAKKLGHA
ncbi:MAG: hypothetical protein LBP95_07950 [Deltaproteobacteria bacterium]|jgi:hypothetical protein|nr:hypothetical protein [Deltaproteobacteria bacterium]